MWILHFQCKLWVHQNQFPGQRSRCPGNGAATPLPFQILKKKYLESYKTFLLLSEIPVNPHQFYLSPVQGQWSTIFDEFILKCFFKNAGAFLQSSLMRNRSRRSARPRPVSFQGNSSVWLNFYGTFFSNMGHIILRFGWWKIAVALARTIFPPVFWRVRRAEIVHSNIVFWKYPNVGWTFRVACQ